MNDNDKTIQKAKLLAAAAEVKRVLEKHDLAGVIILHTPGLVEYTMRVDPTYSCVHMRDQVLVVNRRLPAEPPARKQKIVDTLNMLVNLRTALSRVVLAFVSAEQGFTQHFNIRPRGHQNSDNGTNT